MYSIRICAVINILKYYILINYICIKKIKFNFRNSVLVNLHYIKASLIKFAYFVLDDLNICIVTDLKKKNLKDIWIFLLRILSLLIFKICKLITFFYIFNYIFTFYLLFWFYRFK